MPEINLPTKNTQDQIKQGVDSIITTLPTIDKTLRSRVFTSSGTFTVPAGVTQVYLTGGGGGGGGGGSHTNDSDGGAGGITSFGSLKSISGGSGGKNGVNSGTGGARGGMGGVPGQSGTKFLAGSLEPYGTGGDGGASGWYQAGTGGSGPDFNRNATPGAYCCGGGGATTGNPSSIPLAGGGGGGADFIVDFPVSVTPGQVINVTIGASGTAGSSRAANGGSGLLIVKWWE